MVSADHVMDEMQSLLREAGTGDAGTVERCIETAARALGLPYSRAWSIWYGKAKRLDAHEYLAARAHVEEMRQRKAAQRAHAETLAQAAARSEIEDLKRSIAALESRLGGQP